MNTHLFPFSSTWTLIYFLSWHNVYFTTSTLTMLTVIHFLSWHNVYCTSNWTLIHFLSWHNSFLVMAKCLVHLDMNTLSFSVRTQCLGHFYFNIHSFCIMVQCLTSRWEWEGSIGRRRWIDEKVRASMWSHGSQCHAITWKCHFWGKLSIFCFPLIDWQNVHWDHLLIE